MQSRCYRTCRLVFALAEHETVGILKGFPRLMVIEGRHGELPVEREGKCSVNMLQRERLNNPLGGLLRSVRLCPARALNHQARFPLLEVGRRRYQVSLVSTHSVNPDQWKYYWG